MKITHEYKLAVTLIGDKKSEQKFKGILDDMANKGFLLSGYCVYRGNEHHMIFTKIENVDIDFDQEDAVAALKELRKYDRKKEDKNE